MTQAILFDLDGTLIDTAVDMVGALQQLANKYGINQDFDVADYRQFISKGALALVKSIFEKQSDKDYETLRLDYLDIYQQNLHKHNSLFEGVDSLIQWLDEQQIAWGIVTNKPSWLAQPIINSMAELTHCKTVICADEVGVAKPDPKPLYVALSEIKIEANNCYYLGDAESDIQAANKAGMISLIAKWGYLAPEDQISQWRSNAIINHPKEIIQLFKNTSL